MKQVIFYELDICKKIDKLEYPTDTNTKKKVFIRRYIKLEPFIYDRGSGISVKIMDIFDYIDGLDIYIPNIHQKVKDWDIYDRDLPEQRELMLALSSGDLRGKFANNTVYHLFYTFFKDKLDDIGRYAPEWVEMIKKSK